MKDHHGRDRNSHSFKHSVESGHVPILKNDFKISENLIEQYLLKKNSWGTLYKENEISEHSTKACKAWVI